MAGWPVLVSDIGKVIDGTPAMEAGFKAGDQVVAINGEPVWRWDDMRTIIAKNAGQKLTVTVEREGSRTDLTVTPKLADQKDMLGETWAK